jgi:hypothetical protein
MLSNPVLRRLKFDGFDDICYPYVPPVLEGRLRPQNVSFAELSKRESFSLLDSDLKLLRRESRRDPGSTGGASLRLDFGIAPLDQIYRGD